MRSIRDYEALRCVRATFPDTNLITHIERRVELLMEQGFSDFTELAFFLIAEPGDTEDDIVGELGFSPLVNLVDGCRYGEPEFAPSWEWIAPHCGWFELVYILSDDGFGWIVFVADREGVEPDLLALCRAQAAR